DVPALAAGTHQLQLVKNGDASQGNVLSKLSILTVVSNAHADSATLNRGTLTITGTGFGTKPATNSQLYVSVSHAGNQLVSKSITSWSSTQIKANFKGVNIAAGDVVTVMTADSGQTTATIQ
ncbi:MAG TPA: hypothetical protein VIO11_00105, partial [Candidatus Methanoperedens sp.]